MPPFHYIHKARTRKTTRNRKLEKTQHTLSPHWQLKVLLRPSARHKKKNQNMKFEFIWLTCWVDENCGRKEERWIVRLLPTLLDNRLKVSLTTWPFLRLSPLLGVGSHASPVAGTEKMNAHACRTHFNYIYYIYMYIGTVPILNSQILRVILITILLVTPFLNIY